MPKSHGLLPAAVILVGMFLVACGAFAAIPTLIPTLTSTPVPSATLTTIPIVMKVSTATVKPMEPATPTPLSMATETYAGLDGKTLLEQRCNACHPSSYVTGLRGTLDQWAGLVRMMVQNGADLNPQEEQVLANYLSQTYH
jgi:cytochrome c5